MNRIAPDESDSAALPAKTPPPTDGRLPPRVKVHFGMGFIANNLMIISLEHMLFPVYSLYIGLSPAVIGLAFAVPRLWDAFMDVMVGIYSDNLRTRWGRRRPLIVAGAVSSGIAFAFIWMVPASLSATGSTVWLLGTLILFWTANTFYFIPLDALGMSLTENYDERTSVMAYRSFFAKIGQLASGWSFWLMETGWLGIGRVGAISVGWLWGSLVIFFGVWPGVFLRENTYAEARLQPRSRFWETVKLTFRSRSFLRITGYLLFASTSLSISNAIHFYTHLHYVAQSDSRLAAQIYGVAISLNIVFGMLALPLVGWSSRRIGKHRTAQIAVSATGFGALSSWFLMTPSWPWLSLGIAPFIGVGIVAVYQLYFAMLADAAEEAALLHGRRSEGMYSAVSNCMVKAGQAAALAFAGGLLGWIGIEGKDMVPDEEQILWLRGLRASLPVALSIGAVLCLNRYPLTRKRLEEMRVSARAAV